MIQRSHTLGVLTCTASFIVASASFAAPASGSQAHVLPPDLAPILSEIQSEIAKADPSGLLARAQIAIHANQVRFVHPQTGETLLVLTEHLASPWFAGSAPRVPPVDVQRVLDLLGRRLQQSPWRAPSSPGMGAGPLAPMRDPWQGEPMRSIAFSLGEAALVWSAIGYGLFLAFRSRRPEPASAPKDSPATSP